MRRCIAPIDDDSPYLCGDHAFETRTVEGVELPLCPAHLAELDAERADGETSDDETGTDPN